jgi:hypothetical protein
MDKNLLRLLGFQILGLGFVLSVLEFFIDNSILVVIASVILIGISYLKKR